MTMRITGMNSGLDTESIIQELVKAKSAKVDKIKKDKTKFEWKQEAWTALNTKIKAFQTTLSNFRFSSSYKKKTTTVSQPNAVSVITGDGALNGVQTLKINKLAKSGYMTGAKMKVAAGSELSGQTTLNELRFKTDADGNENSGLAALTEDGGSFTVKVGDQVKKIKITSGSTITDVANQIRGTGVDVNVDEKNGRIFIASTASGAEKDFSITADDAQGFTALTLLGINESLGTSEDASVNANAKTLSEYKRLAAFDAALSAVGYKTNEEGESVLDSESFLAGLDVNSDLYKAIKAEIGDASKEPTAEDMDAAIESLKNKAAFAEEITTGSTYTEDMYSSEAERISGSDASITLNGVEYTSGSNNIQVAGITYTCLAVTTDPVTVTTQEDTDGIYDMIKDLFKQFNELINEMDKLYNAESADKFQPLTDEEKDEMSEKEIEKWEQKIKDAVLRRDDSLSTISRAFKEELSSGIEVNGKTLYLSNFGIETLSYMLAGKNEKNAYHIAGDPDDKDTASAEDKLKSAIANNSDEVITFFVEMSRNLYKRMDKVSAGTDYSSTGSFYDDKKYKSDLNDYNTRIKEAEAKLAAYEDKYYKKFSSMEVALSKLQSNTNSLVSMLGGNN